MRNLKSLKITLSARKKSKAWVWTRQFQSIGVLTSVKDLREEVGKQSLRFLRGSISKKKKS